MGPRKNHQIRAKEVRLVVEGEGNIGVVTLEEALAKAKELDKDLVEVSANTNPPVVKVIDYSKYLYELRKKKKQSSKTGKVKEMKEYRFTPVIADNDIAFRVRRAKHYLKKGHNVRITMFRKGRLSREQALSKFKEILTNFEGYSSIEPDYKTENRKTYITFKADGKTEK